MKAPDLTLIRERNGYPIPEAPPRAEIGRYEWRFADQYGNKFGRLLYRRAAEEIESDSKGWVDVFGHDVHLSESFFTGADFAVAAIADDEVFTIQLIRPPFGPKEIFRQKEGLELGRLNADQSLILVQAAVGSDWISPGMLVLDLTGRIIARLDEFAGVQGCMVGSWSPRTGDQRIVFQQEASGFFQPAIWWPLEGRAEAVATGLKGEVFPIWDKTGQALVLKRCLESKSDLWRLRLNGGELKRLQPLDGCVYDFRIDANNRAVGMWSSNGRYVEHFAETERRPVPGFKPPTPLHAFKYRRIAGVPCLVIESAPESGPRWTIFEGYGMGRWHYTDAYYVRSQVLADHGFQVVQVNTRGSAGFGRAWRQSRGSNLGFTELEDLARVRAALIDEGLVDPERTIISGDSWGGLMALLAMGTQPNLWRMGVAFAPVGDYERVYWEASPLIRATNRTEFGGDPLTRREAYRKVSPTTYVDAIRAPLMVFAGTHDFLCPRRQTEAFVEAVRAEGELCEYELYEGGHGAPGRIGRFRQLQLMLDFLFRRCSAIDG